MDIEKQVKSLLQQQEDIDSDDMLQRFHSYRADRYQRRSRSLTGVAAMLVILLLGSLTLKQIQNPLQTPIPEDAFYSENHELVEEVYSELAAYLLDETDDVWETVEFLYDIDYEPITELITGGS